MNVVVLEEQTSKLETDNRHIVDKSSVQTVTREMEDLPPKPVEPLPEDCCGQGCQPCIFDIYQQQLTAWESECRRLKKAESISVDENVLSPARWSQFSCTCVEGMATNVNLYKFKSAVFKNKLKLNPGQYLLAQSCLNCAITRAYTPLPDEDGNHFAVLVKLYDGGLMSAFWRNVHVGDVMLWKGPYETGLDYTPNRHRQLMMFCAGTGVAPCYSLAYHITADECDETFVRLIFSCRTRHDMLLREALHHLGEYWNFTYRMVLTQDDGIGLKRWYGEDVSSGRITSDLVANELTGKNSVYVIICGTQSFNKAVCGYVRKCGILQENIKVL